MHPGHIIQTGILRYIEGEREPAHEVYPKQLLHRKSCRFTTGGKSKQIVLERVAKHCHKKLQGTLFYFVVLKRDRDKYDKQNGYKGEVLQVDTGQVTLHLM